MITKNFFYPKKKAKKLIINKIGQLFTPPINRFGKNLFTDIDLHSKRKLSRSIPDVTFSYKFKYNLFNKKKYPFKKIKKLNKYLTFYLKSNYYHILERDKIEKNLFYLKSFFLKKEFDLITIKKQLKLDFLNQKKFNLKKKNKNSNLLQSYAFNIFGTEPVLLVSTNLKKKKKKSEKSSFKKLLIFNKNLKKKTLLLIKKVNLLKQFWQKNKLFSKNKFNFLFENLKNNKSIFYTNINMIKFQKIQLQKKKKLNFVKVFLKEFLQNFFKNFFLKKKLKTNKTINLILEKFQKQKRFSLNKLAFFRHFLKTFFINLFLKFANLKNFKYLSLIFQLSKTPSKLTNLLFENKPNLIINSKNYDRKIKNLQLKWLQKDFPDNIYNVARDFYIPKKQILTKEHFKSVNDSIAFLNSKKLKNKLILIEKKNLFFNKNQNFFSMKRKFLIENYFNNVKFIKKFYYRRFLIQNFILTSPIYFGKIKYLKNKKKKYAKKSTFRKKLNLLNRLFFSKLKKKNKFRRKNLALELNSAKVTKLLRQDFDGHKKFFVTKY